MKHEWFISHCIRCDINFTSKIELELYQYKHSNNLTYKEAAKYIFEEKYKCISDDEYIIKKLLE